ncbi:MAG: hypothetical protein ACREIA_03860 [Opitutaceae bacterium]
MFIANLLIVLAELWLLWWWCKRDAARGRAADLEIETIHWAAAMNSAHIDDHTSGPETATDHHAPGDFNSA